MGKQSVRQPVAGLGSEPVVRRAVHPVVRPFSRDELARRFQARKYPPAALIVVSLLAWALIFLVGAAVFQALT